MLPPVTLQGCPPFPLGIFQIRVTFLPPPRVPEGPELRQPKGGGSLLETDLLHFTPSRLQSRLFFSSHHSRTNPHTYPTGQLGLPSQPVRSSSVLLESWYRMSVHSITPTWGHKYSPPVFLARGGLAVVTLSCRFFLSMWKLGGGEQNYQILENIKI